MQFILARTFFMDFTDQMARIRASGTTYTMARIPCLDFVYLLAHASFMDSMVHLVAHLETGFRKQLSVH